MTTATLPASVETQVQDRLMPGRRMTLEEFDALPEDPNVDRMLIRGRIWEKPMTKRTRKHSRVESHMAHVLLAWAEQQPEPRPEVYSGEVGCRFPSLESSVGIDVAVVSAELEASLSEAEKYIVGPPLLVVEILSPSDRIEEINLKLNDYLNAGVPMVWIVDPFTETIVVHRPDADPALFSRDAELTGDPYLPGFAARVSRLFGR